MDNKEDRERMAAFSSDLKNVKPQVQNPINNIKKDKSNASKVSGGSAFAGIDMLVAVAVGCFIGWYMDDFFNTQPLFLILCLMFGFAAGFLNIIRHK